MSLPDAWVDRIFERMALVYGHQFLSRWDGMSIAEVKANWGSELRRFQQSWAAIAYALDHLPPDRPPTVLQFRELCASPSAPRPELALSLPRILERADEGSRTVQRLLRAKAENPGCEGVYWALALEIKDREEPGRVSHAARSMYREVLANFRKRRTVNAAPVLQAEEVPWQ